MPRVSIDNRIGHLDYSIERNYGGALGVPPNPEDECLPNGMKKVKSGNLFVTLGH